MLKVLHAKLNSESRARAVVCEMQEYLPKVECKIKSPIPENPGALGQESWYSLEQLVKTPYPCGLEPTEPVWAHPRPSSQSNGGGAILRFRVVFGTEAGSIHV